MRGEQFSFYAAVLETTLYGDFDEDAADETAFVITVSQEKQEVMVENQTTWDKTPYVAAEWPQETQDRVAACVKAGVNYLSKGYELIAD